MAILNLVLTVGRTSPCGIISQHVRLSFTVSRKIASPSLWVHWHLLSISLLDWVNLPECLKLPQINLTSMLTGINISLPEIETANKSQHRIWLFCCVIRSFTYSRRQWSRVSKGSSIPAVPWWWDHSSYTNVDNWQSMLKPPEVCIISFNFYYSRTSTTEYQRWLHHFVTGAHFTSAHIFWVATPVTEVLKEICQG